jgi:predicted ester cyclase
MKRLVFVASAAICCFFISCNNRDSSNDKNLSISRDIFKGIETGDTTKLSSIASDAVDHAGPNGDVKNGDSIKAYLSQMHNHFKDLKIDIQGDAATGDYVYTWSTLKGTALDSSMGFSPNQSVSIPGVDIVKFRDGKAVEHWSFIDQAYLRMMRAQQMPGATTVKVTMGDTSKTNRNDSNNKK